MATGICKMVTVAPRTGTVVGYLQLLRPANLVTAAADVLAGYAAAGLPVGSGIVALLCSGTALYAGGVVLNDCCDRSLDAVERPERPIPRGAVPYIHAAVMGFSLLLTGAFAAFFCSPESGIIAAAVAGLALSYDLWAKHHVLLGPAVMGLCRAGNLLLGLSADPLLIPERWYLALLPLVYIAGITAMSAGEVHGGSRKVNLSALVAFALVCVATVLLGLSASFSMWSLPIVVFLAGRVVPHLWRAYRSPVAVNVRMAVKTGVVSLIVLDAAIAAGYAGPWYGAAILAMLGLAAVLARIFAVT